MPQVAAPRDFAAFRATARGLLGARVPPADVTWAHAALGSLFDDATFVADDAAPIPAVPRELVDLLDAVACHREHTRWALMYRALWRTLHERRELVRDAGDPDVVALQRMALAVRHDCHRMHAFVRFREDADGRYVAWYEPAHLVLERVAPFFAGRFANMRWMIATPDGAIEWDPQTRAVVRAPAPPPGRLPARDDREALWCTYFASVFNAARSNPAAMQRHLPKRVWRNLPEGRTIERLLDDGRAERERLLRAQPVAADAGLRLNPAQLPARSRTAAGGCDAGGESHARESLDACRRCALWERATQPVAGVGPVDAAIVLVGEAPGDREDLEGRPFVGPAGEVLDAALAAAFVARDAIYVTNAVKHFAWEPRGRRRLHRRPAPHEVDACRPWLQAELATVRPRVVVALGATALRALTGAALQVQSVRGAPLNGPGGVRLIATWHPAAILRAPPETAARMRAELVADLAAARSGLLDDVPAL